MRLPPAARDVIGDGANATLVGCVQQSGVRVGPDQDVRRVVAE